MGTEAWIRQAVVEAISSPDDSSSDTFGHLFRDDETGVVIREAVCEDAPAIAGVGARAFHHAHAALLDPGDLVGDVTTRFEISRIQRELARPDERWIVAICGGTVCGFAQLIRAGSMRDGRKLPIELRGLYVAPDWAGLGVGSALATGSLRLSEELGHENLWVSVLEGNDLGLRFFRNRGFEPVGREIVGAGLRTPATVIVLSRAVKKSE